MADDDEITVTLTRRQAWDAVRALREKGDLIRTANDDLLSDRLSETLDKLFEPRWAIQRAIDASVETPEAPDMRAHRLAQEILAIYANPRDLLGKPTMYNAIRETLIKEFDK